MRSFASYKEMGASDSLSKGREVFSLTGSRGEKRSLIQYPSPPGKEHEKFYGWKVERKDLTDTVTYVTVETGKAESKYKPDAIIIFRNGIQFQRICPPLLNDIKDTASEVGAYLAKIKEKKDLLWFRMDHERLYAAEMSAVVCYDIKERDSSLMPFSLRIWQISIPKEGVYWIHRSLHFPRECILKPWIPP